MKTHVEELTVIVPAGEDWAEMANLVWEATVSQVLSVPGMVISVQRSPKLDRSDAQAFMKSLGQELYGQTYVAYKTRVLVNDEIWNAQSAK